jgi:uncharacterized protein with FMN-binding domain
MRRITMMFMTTVIGLVLLFSYRTSTSGARTESTVSAGAAPEGVVSGDPGTSSQDNGGSGSTSSGTVNGPSVSTRWGPVQVQVKIKSGRIADVVALQYPTGERRDEEINSYALPLLHDQVIAAQSANIDGVSGATVTTEGYVRSLQAALDAAHFGS